MPANGYLTPLPAAVADTAAIDRLYTVLTLCKWARLTSELTHNGPEKSHADSIALLYWQLDKKPN